MATTDLTELFTTLFTAPARASWCAEREYRRIWVGWLEDLSRLIAASGGAMDAEGLDRHLAMAPVMRFEGLIELGVTMRVASVGEMRGGLGAGLRLGAIETSGSFGFMSRSTQDSILQAKAQYTLTNDHSMTLSEYLETLSITLANPEDVAVAIEALRNVEGAPLPEPPAPAGRIAA